MKNISLEKRLLPITRDILDKQMRVGDEKQILIYDRQSNLSSLIADAYIQNMPQAQHIDFDAADPDVLRDTLLALSAGSTVIMVQSTSFRLDAFRIRLQLFNNGVGCLEHTHLHYIDPSQYKTYVDALEYRGDYYKALGGFLAEKIENCNSIEIVSRDRSILTFGEMEEGKLNHGVFWDQKNRGGGAMCGEIFSEAKDFSSVNGEMSIFCYPGEDFRIIECEPFRIQISESMVSSNDPKCPVDFRENVLERIARDEDGEVMLREAGFGLNPAISPSKPLADVNAFERMAGFHVSLGKKHQIYRRKMPKDMVQRYHMDIFPDTDEIRFDGEVVYKEGAYLFEWEGSSS